MKSAGLPACFVDCLGFCFACWFGFSFEIVSSHRIFHKSPPLPPLRRPVRLLLRPLPSPPLSPLSPLPPFPSPPLSFPPLPTFCTMHWQTLECVKTFKKTVRFAGFCSVFDFLTIAMRSTMQVLQPQRLFTNKPLRKTAFTQALPLHKHCLYTSPAFNQTRFYTRPAFTQTLSLHNCCLYTSTAFTQVLLLHKSAFTQDRLSHKRCLHTNAVFTQALSLHKHCFYTSSAFTQERFYTSPPFTQMLSVHKPCLYTSIAFYKPCFYTMIFAHTSPLQPANRQGWRAGGMPKAVK